MINEDQYNEIVKMLNSKSERIASYYSEYLTFLHGWVIAINAGGMVSVLSYIASDHVSRPVKTSILWALIIFGVGVCAGLLWAFINFCALLSMLKQFNTYMQDFLKTKSPKDWTVSDIIANLNLLTWVMGIVSAACILMGFAFGLYSIMS